MEPSESESVGSFITIKRLLFGSLYEPSSRVPNHDHDPQPSDPDLKENSGLKDGDENETRELGGKFHDKLGLRDEGGEGGGEGETEKKDSDFEAGGGELGGETKKGSDLEAGGGELGSETEKKGSDFEAGGEVLGGETGAPESGEVLLGGETGAPESGEVQGSDDGWNGDEGYGWNGDEGYGWNENVKESEADKLSGDGGDDDDDDDDGVEGGEVEKKENRSRGRAQQYPLRPDAEDCAFYLKTGSCKFGFNCKFNHPVGRRKNQAAKEKGGEREEPVERSGQIECKYYLRSGGCKFGKACKFNHTRGKSSAAPLLELNFLGLPIRLGEKECPYYMRTGSCKFGANCKFNHPDPTSVGGSDSPSGYGNGNSMSLQGVSQPSAPSWSSSKALNETTPFVPVIVTPTQAVSPRSSDWSGYQAPVYLSERSMHPPPPFVMNNPAIETNIYMHHQKQMPAEEFPERPGEPECGYFLKTGDCKFKSNCKFNHPKNRIARLPPFNLSDKGLPLRPDQNVCTHYSRYGICKFGPACKYDHPLNPSPATVPGLDQQTSYTNSDSV